MMWLLCYPQHRSVCNYSILAREHAVAIVIRRVGEVVLHPTLVMISKIAIVSLVMISLEDIFKHDEYG